LPVKYITANVLAIAVCSILNYILCDRLVFARRGNRSSVR
jgi:putative flippase GtrA